MPAAPILLPEFNMRLPACAGLCSLAASGQHLWAGTEDGHLIVWHAGTETLVHSRQAHSDRVSCLAAVGPHIWSGSGDRSIVAHDAATFAALYSLGDQGELPGSGHEWRQPPATCATHVLRIVRGLSMLMGIG